MRRPKLGRCISFAELYPATAALEIAMRTRAPFFIRVADDDRWIEAVAGGTSRVAKAGKAALKLVGHGIPSAWPFSHPQSLGRLLQEARGFAPRRRDSNGRSPQAKVRLRLQVARRGWTGSRYAASPNGAVGTDSLRNT